MVDALGSAPGNFDRSTIVAQEVLFSQGAAAVDITSLPAGSVVMRAWADVLTVFNAATTNVIEVGTDADIARFLAAADVNEAALGVTPVAGKGPFPAETADRTLRCRYTQTGGAATTGRAMVYVEYTRPR